MGTEITALPMVHAAWLSPTEGRVTHGNGQRLLDLVRPLDIWLVTSQTMLGTIIDLFTRYGKLAKVPRVTHGEVTIYRDSVAGPVNFSAEARAAVAVQAARLLTEGHSGEIWRPRFATQAMVDQAPHLALDFQMKSGLYDFGGAAHASRLSRRLLAMFPPLDYLLRERKDAWFCTELLLTYLRALGGEAMDPAIGTKAAKANPRGVALSLRNQINYRPFAVFGLEADQVTVPPLA